MDSSTPRSWPSLSRLGFRAVFFFWILCALPGITPGGLFTAIPGFQSLTDRLFDAALHAATLLHLPGVGQATAFIDPDHGESVVYYALLLVFALISILAALAWTGFDRSRHDHLQGWLRLLVRYMLAFALLNYGIAKVIPSQFGTLRLTDLMTPLGQLSPGDLLWKFMAASPLYILFAGLAEVAGGALLLLDRTTTLGALIALADLINVLAMNVGYDVGVPIFTAVLLGMSVFLLAPECGRLANFFLGRAVPAPRPRPPLLRGHLARALGVTALAALTAHFLVFNIREDRDAYRAELTRPALYGLYDVRSGPPGWRTILIDAPAMLTVRMADGTERNFLATFSASAITFAGHERWSWTRVSATQIEARGTLDGTPIALTLAPADLRTFHLPGRPRWTNLP